MHQSVTIVLLLGSTRNALARTLLAFPCCEPVAATGTFEEVAMASPRVALHDAESTATDYGITVCGSGRFCADSRSPPRWHSPSEPETAEHQLLAVLPEHMGHLKPDMAGAITMHLLARAPELLDTPGRLPHAVSEALKVCHFYRTVFLFCM